MLLKRKKASEIILITNLKCHVLLRMLQFTNRREEPKLKSTKVWDNDLKVINSIWYLNDR